MVSTGNLNTTQQSAVDHLSKRGVRVVGRPTQDPDEQDGYLWEVVRSRPQLLLDNGGDLFVRYLEERYDGLLGGTEETTSGRARLDPLRDRIGLPVLVINDSPIKQFAENRHAVGQSVLESFLRITNKSTNGRRVTVFGYGACGKGVAANFRNAYAVVSVVERDPVVIVVEVDPLRALEAAMDGFEVTNIAAAAGRGDLFVTATGNLNVLGKEAIGCLKDGAILANAGHVPWEIDAAGIEAAAGGRVTVLEGGHMVNLAGPRPLGNSIESMDLGFALQARCLEAVAKGEVGPEACIVPVPRAIDEAVAAAYVAGAA